ncbi:vomeronasal type-2 receptor 26-like [Dendropsophus ebraccatus]|uniref:vomeronasal type-2 receptor 26-like n=1 Tax=Dendropsophus ebraccatus TaxID=150705 RepID=UPI00383140A2
MDGGSRAFMWNANMTIVLHSWVFLYFRAVFPLHKPEPYPSLTFKEKPPEDLYITFLLDFYQYFQAMRFAVDEINRSQELLPNVSLGFHAYDSCAVRNKEMEGTLWMLTGLDPAIPNYCCRESPPLAAIIGHSTSSFSIQMAHMLGLYRFPQVSSLSTSPLLSDRTQFPSFFRTVPSDTFQSLGLAQMVKHFGWTWVGLIGVDNDYGREGIKLLYYIKKVQVPSISKREVFFNKDGDPPAMYDIVNWQRRPDGSTALVKIGSYDSAARSNGSFTINSSLVWWPHGSHERLNEKEVEQTQQFFHNSVPISACSESCSVGFRKAPREGEPSCCFKCVPCPQGEISNQTDSIDCSKCPWDMWPNNRKDNCLVKPTEYLSYGELLGLILMAISISSSVVPIFIFRLFHLYKNTPMVRANNYSLSCILLVSLSFCFLSSLAFIGYPEKEKCLLRQAAFGMVFALCVSCILAKTIMVVFAFMATKPGSSLKRWTRPRVSYMIIVFCSLLQLVLCVSWILASPPFTHMNIDSKPGILVIECNENSPIAFWIMLGYLGLLASISFIVAFYARRLPDSFNEAKFITFSMLAFLSVWLSYIPASLSSQGKYTVAMEIFAIQASSWALVICMFLPKCFIILFRPHMNTKEHLLGKDKSQN